MTRRLLATTLACVLPLGLALAQAADDGALTGIAACDAFLKAYMQCAATPGLPGAVRDSINGAIPSLRSNFRGASARRNSGAECLQLHGAMRQSLVENYKCNFPAPDGTAAAAGPALADSPANGLAAQPAASPDQQEAAKANAWTEAQNDLAEWHHMERDLASYLQGTERMPKPGAKPNPNNWYDFGISGFGSVIAKLRAAAALPGAVPEVDAAGTSLLAALEALDPIITRLSRYQTTREFKEDSYKLAREQHPILVARMKAAIKAADLFSTALFDRGMARDEQQVASLPKGSLQQRLMATSLSARRAIRQHDLLQPRTDTKPLLAAVTELSDNNKALLATLDATTPKPDSYCNSYSEYIDTMIGSGRDLARDIRSGGNPSSTSEAFIRAYNNSVDKMASCQERQAGR